MNLRCWIAGCMAVAAAVAAFSSAPAPVIAAPADSVTTIELPDSMGTITGVVEADTSGLSDPRMIKSTLERMGRREVDAPRQWERSKDPQLSMLCSALLPGLGQVYNGRRLKVGVMVGIAYYYMSRTWLNWRRHKEYLNLRNLSATGSSQYRRYNNLSGFYREEARTFMWWSGLVWILGILDSWIDAHLYDVRAYQPPPPPEVSGVPASERGTTYLTWSFSLSLGDER